LRFGVVLLALGRDEQAGAVRWIALIGAVISLLVTFRCIRIQDLTSAMQFVEKEHVDRAIQRQLPPGR
jgi:NADH-quinone oxidoreductase subunit M